MRWFSEREFACRGSGRMECRPELLQACDELREILGVPLVVLSGYRSSEYNREIGGAPGSYHVLGLAVDFLLPNCEPLRFFAAAAHVGFRGVGCYPGFVHLDLGPARYWVGR